MRDISPRAGGALVEALVGLVLTMAILGSLAAAAAAARRALESVAMQVEEVEAARVARVLMRHVVDGGRFGPNSATGGVHVDFPIGTAVPCDTVWRWSGVRAPVAGRDSVILIDSLSRVWRAMLTEASPSECEGDPAWALRSDARGGPAVHLTLFEAGTIRVDDAVRYGRSGTPRQPLTAALLDRRYSEVIRFDSAGSTWVRLSLTPDSIRIWSRVRQVR